MKFKQVYLICQLIYIIGLMKLTMTQNNCLEPLCNCSEKNVLNCDNFDRFDQLVFKSMNKTVALSPNLILKPKNAIALDSSLSFNGLQYLNNLTIQNINTIDINSPPIDYANTWYLDASIQNTKLSFKNNFNSTLNQRNIFSWLKFTHFYFENTTFQNAIPIYIFHNTDIIQMYFKNPLFNYTGDTFIDNGKDNSWFNLMMYILSLENSNIPFNSSTFLNPYLFKNLAILELLNTPILDIDENISINFRRFRSLVFHSKFNLNPKWLKNLNSKVYFNLDKYNVDSKNVDNVFFLHFWDDFKEIAHRNICEYRYLPHKQLVVPTITQGVSNIDVNDCTCVIYWIFKYQKRYVNVGTYNYTIKDLAKCLSVNNFDKIIKSCDFENNFNKLCGNETNSNNNTNKAEFLYYNNNNILNLFITLFLIISYF